MDWQPGQWVECPHTQEKGKILFYNGRSICISLGTGITLYASPDLLEILGWRPIQSYCLAYEEKSL
ncbi:hypothetical protein [Leptolyngbya sp. Heron Island J]|uniref:hypothetical protein n=1 Tax=Leptolyngbya sp. Heron Island J TaxID=1385935 RepID=UPI00041BE4D2|nr:hypothetical protein [Leptolyngbya sp. Heron Island J]